MNVPWHRGPAKASAGVLRPGGSRYRQDVLSERVTTLPCVWVIFDWAHPSTLPSPRRIKSKSRTDSQAGTANIAGRAGFTLLEISLVLVALVILTALAVPNFQGALERERLRKAVESIAADWTLTRAAAMETGEMQIWACELGAGNYSASAPSAASNVSATGDAMPTLGVADVSSIELTEVLPTGYVISRMLSSELHSMTSMAMTSQSSESGRAAVFFYPDGTCSNARLTVNHEDTPEYSRTVTINGLAGTVRVLPVSTSSGANQ